MMRTSRLLRWGLALLVALTVVPARPVYAADPDAGALAQGLRDLAPALGALATLEQLAAPLPLTALSPASAEGLCLERVFGEALGARLPATPGSLEELADALRGLSGRYCDDGVSVAFSDVAAARRGGGAEISLSFSLTREVTAPIQVAAGDASLSGGALALALAASARLTLRYDPAARPPDEALALVMAPDAPAVRVTAASTAALAPFLARLGFIEVEVGGPLALDIALEARLRDPDGDGRLSRDEWRATAPVDLFEVAYGPGAGVSAALALEARPAAGSDLLAGSPDGTISLVDADLSDGLAAPEVRLNGLADFAGFSPSVMLQGLNTLAGGLRAFQLVSEPLLPFSNQALLGGSEFAEPLVTLVRRQGEAAILCGTEPSDPPRGDVWNAPAGATIYCQAITTGAAAAVEWSIANGTVTANGGSLATIGPNPTQNAAFRLSAAGTPRVTVRFDDPPASADTAWDHEVVLLFRTVQELAEQIEELGGFALGPGDIAYDPATSALTLRLAQAREPTSYTAALRFGDALLETTRLANLQASDGATPDVTVKAMAFDVTFGTILAGDDAAFPQRTQGRYFVRASGGAPLLQASVALEEAPLSLSGRIGYVGVTVTGDAAASPTGSAALTVTPNDAARPMFQVRLMPPGEPLLVPGRQPVSGALRLSEVISRPLDFLSTELNIHAAAGLKVTAQLSDATRATGSVSIDWPNYGQPGDPPPQVKPSPEFAHDLASLDINPDNPLELLSVVLDSLDLVSTELGRVTDLDSPLPVLGRRPRDLLPQLARLQEALDTIRTAEPGELPLTLQELDARLSELLEGALADAAPNLAFTIEPLDGAEERHLVVQLGYARAASETAKLQFGLDSHSLVQSGNELAMDVAGALNLDVAIPLTEATRAKDIAGQLQVLPTTGATLRASVRSEDLSFSAGISHLSLKASGRVQAGVELRIGSTADAAQTLDEYRNTLSAKLEGQGAAVCESGAAPADACAQLDLALDTMTVGSVRFRAPDIANSASWEASSEFVENIEDLLGFPISDLEDLINSPNLDLDLALLFEALPELLERSEALLRGGEQLPLVGPELGAGAATLARVNDELRPLRTLAQQLNAKGTQAAVADEIRREVARLLAPQASGAAAGDLADSPGLLRDDVKVTCDGGPCGDASLKGLNDLRVSFTLGQEFTQTIPLSLGAGFPLSSEGGMSSTAGWALKVSFGVDRAHGPYLNVGEPSELSLEASVRIAEAPAEGGRACAAKVDLPGDVGRYSDTRCIAATLGFLGVSLYDSETNPTRAEIKSAVDLQSSGGPLVALDRLGDLTFGGPGLGMPLVNVDLLFRTGISIERTETRLLPKIVGTLRWDSQAADNSAAFDNLYIDVSDLSSYLFGDSSVTETINDIIAPLRPVIDAAYAPIPVLSDISKMVGGGAVRLVDLAKLQDNFDTEMIDRIVELIRFTELAASGLIPIAPAAGQARLAASAGPAQEPGGPLLLPLGSFTVDMDRAALGPVLPDQVAMLIGGSAMIPNVLDGVAWRPAPPSAGPPEAPAPGQPGEPTPGPEPQPARFRTHLPLIAVVGAGATSPAATAQPALFFSDIKLPKGLSFPFLEDTTSLAAMLLGGDAVLVRYDAGKARLSAGISQSLGPITVGPVPVMIGFAGAIALEGRFAMGYDTYGLRTGKGLLEGLYIDDYDSKGRDVPEIAFKGSIAVSAGVTVLVVEAGVFGGIELTVGLDLRDTPDGRLRFGQIRDSLTNPICLFEATGKLGAHFGLYFKVGFAFLSKTFRIRLVDITLLDFSKDLCNQKPPEIRLAHVDGDRLILNMGAYAGLRGIAADVVDEEFTLRQMSRLNGARDASGKPATAVAITAFDITQTYYVPENGRIFAEASGGDDTIALLPGYDQTQACDEAPEGGHLQDDEQPACPPPVAFEVPAELYGGAGDDELQGGDARDRLYGGPGNDALDGGAGDDILWGWGAESRAELEKAKVNPRLCSTGAYADRDEVRDPDNDDQPIADDDTLSGGLGDDILCGEAGADTLNGGPGGDKLFGGGGDDTLLGGHSGAEANPDRADTIVGGPGRDIIEGHAGDDLLVGDGMLNPEHEDPTHVYGACEEIRSAPAGATDSIDGGDGEDCIHGGPGDDLLAGDVGADTIDGGDGDDTIDGDDDEPATPDANDRIDGGDGDDLIWGRGGDDTIDGGDGDDDIFGHAGDDVIYGGDGDDDISGGAGADVIAGGAGRDYIFGDDGFAGRPPGAADPLDPDQISFSETRGDADTISGGDGDDVIYGEGGADLLHGDDGDDTMYGNGGDDTMYGDAGDDLMRGGTDDDAMEGNGGDDEMHGDSGADVMYGNDGDDLMRGGMGADYMEGNAGDDEMRGDADQDNMIGGTSGAGAPDGRDRMRGDADHDYMAGDNAEIVALPDVLSPDGAHWRHVLLFDSDSEDPRLWGADEMDGGPGNDRMYGQGGDDWMRGGEGQDYLEGNAAADTLEGGPDQDDLIGGSSEPGRRDGDDRMWGEGAGEDDPAGHDVMAGDNARIERLVDERGAWRINSFNGSVARAVHLFDVATTARPVSADLSGDDELYGQGGDDLLYGQGGDDWMRGGEGHDTLYGNQGSDVMFGDAGQDDMVGGGPGGDQLDGADWMWGGGDGPALEGDHDVMAGDNAQIQRLLDGAGQWRLNPFNLSHSRAVTLFDKSFIGSEADRRTGGGDHMAGEGGDDLLYGQGGGDTIDGGDGDDYIEGNEGGDALFGGPGQDDLIGGSSEPGRSDGGDTIYGGDGKGDLPDDFDVLAGDNARIARPLTCGAWQVNAFNLSVRREVTLFEVPTVNRTVVVAGDDRLYGEGGDDLLYAQAGDDLLYGGRGDDYMEGNAGDDELHGEEGNDDMVGGTGRLGGDPASGVDGRLDGADRLFGGPGFDVVAGDNAIIARAQAEPPERGPCDPLVGGLWERDPVHAGIAHEPTILLDLGSPDEAAVSGDDLLRGGDDEDLLFGQGGENDLQE